MQLLGWRANAWAASSPLIPVKKKATEDLECCNGGTPAVMKVKVQSGSEEDPIAP